MRASDMAVKAIRRGLLRVSSLSRIVVLLLGLRSADLDTDTFLRTTQVVDRVQVFISHSWQADPWLKVLALCFEMNLMLAVKASCFTYLITSLALLQAAGGITSPSARTVLTDSPWTLPLTLDLPMLVFFTTFFFGHWMTQEIWTPRIWFDKACINQADVEQQEEVVTAIPDIVKRSSCLLVLLDETFLGRLWCNLELATFAKSHSDPDALHIVPLWLPAWFFCSLLCEWLVARLSIFAWLQSIALSSGLGYTPKSDLDFIVNGVLVAVLMAVGHAPSVLVAAFSFTARIEQCDVMLDQFGTFDVRCSECGVTEDRPKLHSQIARLFDEIDDPPISVEIEVPVGARCERAEVAEESSELLQLLREPSVRQLTTYPTEEDCFNLFNTYVRQDLCAKVTRDVAGKAQMRYGVALLVFLPNVFWLVTYEYLQCERAGCDEIAEAYGAHSFIEYILFGLPWLGLFLMIVSPLTLPAMLHALAWLHVLPIWRPWKIMLAFVIGPVVDICVFVLGGCVYGFIQSLLVQQFSPSRLVQTFLVVTAFMLPWSMVFFECKLFRQWLLRFHSRCAGFT